MVADDQGQKSANEFVSSTQGVHRFGRHAVSLTRFIVTLPVVGLFLSSVVLVVLASYDAVTIVLEIMRGELAMKEVLVKFIELADIYLLAIVLYIIALGLYELFIDDRVPLPKWLEIHTLEDLKEKLVGVVVVVLAVLYLGKVIEGGDALSLLYLGAGIAAVTAALAYFVGTVLAKKH